MNDTTASPPHNSRGTILQIQRMSTEDGPGIRSTVFFKGCSLSCIWCQNPESLTRTQELQWMKTRCIGCRSCINACPEGALTLGEAGMVIDRTRCTVCVRCSDACPSTAMELIGKEWELDSLVTEVLKDRVYFEKSEGGVTLSGGEPSVHGRFAAALLRALKSRGIHTALDTCGQASWETLETLLTHTDLVLFDVKEIDPEKHRRLTGRSNELILENLIRLRRHIEAHAAPQTLWVRTPMVPNATACRENIEGIGNFLARELAGAVSRWELCAFNNLCRDKYLRLDQHWPYHNEPLMTKEEMEACAAVARASGVAPGIVHWSGPTRVERN